MEKRVLLAIFLSFLVLYAYQSLVVKPAPKPLPSAAGTVGSPEARGALASKAAVPDLPAPATPAGTPVVADNQEQEVRIETRDVVALFTNRGARLKSWRLKRFRDAKNEPLELVVRVEGQPLPFSVRTTDEAATATLNDALYSSANASQEQRETSAPVDLRFEYRDSTGLQAIKEFHLDPAGYIVAVRATATQGDRPLAPLIEWGPGIGDAAPEVSSFTKGAEGLLSTGGKVRRLAPKDIATQAVYDGDFAYAGVDDQYFMTAAVFAGPAKVTYKVLTLPPPEGSKDKPRDLVSYAIEPARPGEALKFFAGPKDFDVLRAIDPQFIDAIDFGMFRVLVVPLLQSLKWINGYVGNYGWAIILLTIIINAIMFPLRHKSVVSMRKMQELQPEVKAIQDRYAGLKTTDPARQKMNQELMGLYRERGVNPASGCVPMLLTFPVLIAFYSLLSTAIELRGAPFILWIHDLSLHDPLYITPVLMGASQVWQQRITPAAGADPAQQKMMMFMPVVFTVMFLWAPAGVALYWLMSNLWGIGQQYLTNYLIGPPTIRTVRPPAERQLKRVGGGKTQTAARES